MRKIALFILMVALTISVCSLSGFAAQETNSRVITNENGDVITVKKISLSEVPEGVVPLKVETVDEADKLIIAMSSGNYVTPQAEEKDPVAKTVTYDAQIARVQYGGILSSGPMVTELRVAYTLTFAGGHQYITSASPYTDTYGVPLFATYTEQSCTGYILPGAIDYYGISSGQVDYYIFINGFINWYTAPASLSGTVTLGF